MDLTLIDLLSTIFFLFCFVLKQDMTKGYPAVLNILSLNGVMIYKLYRILYEIRLIIQLNKRKDQITQEPNKKSKQQVFRRD